MFGKGFPQGVGIDAIGGRGQVDAIGLGKLRAQRSGMSEPRRHIQKSAGRGLGTGRQDHPVHAGYVRPRGGFWRAGREYGYRYDRAGDGRQKGLKIALKGRAIEAVYPHRNHDLTGAPPVQPLGPFLGPRHRLAGNAEILCFISHLACSQPDCKAIAEEGNSPVHLLGSGDLPGGFQLVG